MSENEIISILSKFSVEIILLAVLTSIFTGILKKYLPASLKTLTHLLPFLLGTVIYAGYSFLVLKTLEIVTIIKGGFQVGGSAILIYALVKQIGKNSSNAKNAVTDILTGFIDDASLQGTVNRILKEYTSNKYSASSITRIIAETSNVSEQESATLGSLVIKTLETLNTSKTTTKSE